MRSKKGAEFFMLSVVVAAIHSLKVETPKKKMEVKRGGNATLPCTFQTSVTPEKGDIVYWTKVATEIEVINMYLDDYGTMEGIGYEGRVSYSGKPKDGDLSFTLSKLTMDDNGTYECSVRLRADPPVTHASMDLVVLVSPSKPDCQIIGKAEYGYNINLTCNSVEGSPKPQYSWQSYDAQNQPRALEGTASAAGLLMLKNISANTAGYYICTARNSVGEEKCNMTVAIAAPSMNIALYAGIIGGVLAALIIIGVLAYFCCCRKQKEKDYEITETENKYQPPKKAVEIRGPPEEEIHDEEEVEDNEREDEESRKHKPMMPPNNH
ncbi:cell surface A33 antigen [Tiliqua scincoides]|uniref:cell surface A33 antigen n=1 Tax=Tiliqua scincoides TaxID=71010 RepID=UPI003461A8D0